MADIVVINSDTTTILNNDVVEVIEINTSPIEVITIGVQGPPGVDNVGIRHTFAFGDATPTLIFSTSSNDTVYRVELTITTPFDGIGASLSIGSQGNPLELLSTNQVDPYTIGTYQSNECVKYTSPTDVKLFITPGSGASTGSGFILIYK